MTDYTIFDKALTECIRRGATQFYELNSGPLLKQAMALAKPDRRGDRDGWRVIDRRLQALRKAGKLTYDRKAGWRVS